MEILNVFRKNLEAMLSLLESIQLSTKSSVIAHGSQILLCNVKTDIRHYNIDLCIVPKRFCEVATK